MTHKTSAYATSTPVPDPGVDSTTTTQTAIATNLPTSASIPTVVCVTDSCACGHIGDCDYPDCMNGAYHGTSPLRFITISDHHIKPLA